MHASPVVLLASFLFLNGFQLFANAASLTEHEQIGSPTTEASELVPLCDSTQDENSDVCIGTLHYLIGDQEYVGEIKNNTAHGQGTLSTGGAKYVGTFKDGVREGRGRYVVGNGDEYVGDFKNNAYNGKGRYTWKNGAKFDGLWKDGLPTNDGTLTNASGEVIKGATFSSTGIQNNDGLLIFPLTYSGGTVQQQVAKTLDEVPASAEQLLQFYSPGLVKLSNTGAEVRLNSDFGLNALSRFREDGFKLELLDSVDSGLPSDVIRVTNDSGDHLLDIHRDHENGRIGAMVSYSDSARDPHNNKVGMRLTEILGDSFYCASGDQAHCAKNENSELWYGVEFDCEGLNEGDGLITSHTECYLVDSIRIETRDRLAPSDGIVEPQDKISSKPIQKTQQKQVIGTNNNLRKVALVIGNSNYQHAVPLENPHNDAESMTSLLKGIGFDVVNGTDLDKRTTEQKISEFVDRAAQADVSLFFYAGHGIQVAGENFIVPVDAKVEKASAIDFELVNVSMVTNYMGGEKSIGIALLDACRDNPFTRSLSRALGNRSNQVNTGLAELKSAGGGLLVGFATAPGDVAADGIGMKNSPFTTALLKHLGTKGLEVELMMKRVKAEVIDLTKNQQRPWTNSDLAKEVYLAGQ